MQQSRSQSARIDFFSLLPGFLGRISPSAVFHSFGFGFSWTSLTWSNKVLTSDCYHAILHAAWFYFEGFHSTSMNCDFQPLLYCMRQRHAKLLILQIQEASRRYPARRLRFTFSWFEQWIIAPQLEAFLSPNPISCLYRAEWLPASTAWTCPRRCRITRDRLRTKLLSCLLV